VPEGILENAILYLKREQKKTVKYNYSRLRNDYMTPPNIYKPILLNINRTEFDLDVCCSIKNIPAKKHFIEGKNDGLSENWEKVNWMNPPFSTCEKWIKKAVEEQLKGNTTYAIIPARIETEYFKKFVLKNKHAKFKVITKSKKEGVTFIDPLTNDFVRDKNGKKGLFKNALAIVIFKGVKKNAH
jgi:site-specific DNA-methyltransferase (adenine-specific)